MVSEQTKAIVALEQAILHEEADHQETDEGNIEPGAMSMVSTIASTLDEENPDLDDVRNMLLSLQAMLAEDAREQMA